MNAKFSFKIFNFKKTKNLLVRQIYCKDKIETNQFFIANKK